MEKFSTKAIEAELMQEGGNVKEFIVKAIKLYKEAKIKDKVKLG